MAKDLPFFKFFCSEWSDGDITLEEYDVQGIFINVCAYYWSKECNLSKTNLYKRFKRDSDLLDVLFTEGHIKSIDDYVSITFLDEQFEERGKSSKAKSEAGKKSAELKKIRKELSECLREYSTEFNEDLKTLQKEFNKNSTHVEILLQHISTIKKREEKKREEKNNNKKKVGDEIDLQTAKGLEVNLTPSDFKQQLLKDAKEALKKYTSDDFLKDWNELRKEYLQKPSFLNRIGNMEDVSVFNELSQSYKREDFRNALIGLFKQRKLPNGNSQMQSNPTHFFKYFNSYLTAFHDKNNSLYGKLEKEPRL